MQPWANPFRAGKGPWDILCPKARDMELMAGLEPAAC